MNFKVSREVRITTYNIMIAANILVMLGGLVYTCMCYVNNDSFNVPNGLLIVFTDAIALNTLIFLRALDKE